MVVKKKFITMTQIDKATIAEMEIIKFPGKIVVVDTESDAEAALGELRKETVVGFDTETRPSFKKGTSHRVSLVQISTWDTCYLFRLCKINTIAPVKQLLESTTLLKIGLSLKDDFLALRRFGSIEPHCYLELQRYVGVFNIEDMSLQKIYALLFGKKISKGQQLSNWEAESLTPAQQAYAATDAWACLHIYRALRGESPAGVYPLVFPVEKHIDEKPFIQK